MLSMRKPIKKEVKVTGTFFSMENKIPFLDENSLFELIKLEGLSEANLLSELYKLFESTTPNILSLIEEAYGNSNVAVIEQQAHSLKSSCSSLGMLRLYEESSYLEKNAAIVVEEQKEDVIRELRSCYYESLSALASFISSNNQGEMG